ncbi:conserved hypothetical protein [Streptomyces sp. SPB78]|nr:conserved hypothetical protein [Streptomyces sp. SPB78]
MTGTTGPKTRGFTSVAEILAKLEGKAAMWERVARDNKARAEEFEEAAQQIREGAKKVTVGRTTYVLATGVPTSRDETADGTVVEA